MEAPPAAGVVPVHASPLLHLFIARRCPSADQHRHHGYLELLRQGPCHWIRGYLRPGLPSPRLLGSMGSPHVAVVCFPFSSHAPKLLMVARALATAAPSAAFSFLSTAASIEQLRGAAVPGNLRFVEVPTGGTDNGELPAWRRMELFLEAAEADGLKQALEVARAAAPSAARVTCVVGDAFMSMAAAAGVPWVAVWTGGPCALLAHLRGDALRLDIGDDAESRGDELLTSHPGLGCFRVRDLPFGGANASGDMHRVMALLLHRVAERLPRATAVALNAFPGLFPADVIAALTDVLPNALPIGPYHLIPGATAKAEDPHGCLAWLEGRPSGTVVYVSFGTVAVPPPDELRELASGLEASGAPFLWSLREDSWPLLPPGFVDRARARDSGLLVPWTPQVSVLQHPAVGAFLTHSGWGAVVEGISGGVPMACRPFFGDQQMNARAVAHMWCFGTSFDDDGPMTRGTAAMVVSSLLSGEEGGRIKDRARELQAKVVEAFKPDGGSTKNFRKFVDIVAAHV